MRYLNTVYVRSHRWARVQCRRGSLLVTESAAGRGADAVGVLAVPVERGGPGGGDRRGVGDGGRAAAAADGRAAGGSAGNWATTQAALDACTRRGVRVAALTRGGAVRFTVHGARDPGVVRGKASAAEHPALSAGVDGLFGAEPELAARCEDFCADRGLDGGPLKAVGRRNVVDRWSRDAKDQDVRSQLAERGEALRARVARVADATTGDALRGVEGDAARIYFRAVARVLASTWRAPTGGCSRRRPGAGRGRGATTGAAPWSGSTRAWTGFRFENHFGAAGHADPHRAGLAVMMALALGAVGATTGADALAGCRWRPRPRVPQENRPCR